MTSAVIEAKTTPRTSPEKTCRDCRTRKPHSEFPTDRYDRIDPRMCLLCVEENAPLLMTESELSRWLDMPVERVRQMTPAGSYSPPRGQVVPLYGRPPVDAGSLPLGWRLVFDWSK